MAQKISVYVDEELHKSLKAPFGPSRRESSTKMDVVRKSVSTSYSGDELGGMREEGRREWLV